MVQVHGFCQAMRPNASVWGILLWISMFGAAVSVGAASFKLRLLHTNDMHARFEQTSRSGGKCSEEEAARGLCYGGFARVQTALLEQFARAKRENVSVLSLNAGDTYQGTVWYTFYKWQVVSHFLKMLKIDAMALGNHEFDDGIKGVTPFLKDVGIPIVFANVNSTLEPEFGKSPVKSSLTLEKGGRKIGIIGYLTPDTTNLADTGNLVFEDEIKALKKEANRLKTMGVDIIIAVGHSGYEVDLKIAAEVPDVDVVVGGHSHTFLYTGPPPDSDRPVNTYPVLVTQKNGRKVAMVQAYAFTKYLGVLDLVFDERGELLEAKGNPILLNSRVAEDPIVLREVSSWGSKLNSTLKQPIGKTNVLLDGSLCRFYECNLGNLITDAYIHYAVKNHSGAFWTKAAIAIQQAGGIRASINATATNGLITMEDLVTAMPFFSSLSLVRIKGQYLLEALRWSIARYDPTHNWGRGEFLQMSGLKATFYVSDRPGESMVAKVRVRCKRCRVPRYQDLQAYQDYDVIMPTFLLNGGDGFTMFKEHGKELEKFDESDTEIVLKYIREKGILYNGEEERINFNDYTSGGVNLRSNYAFLLIPVLLVCLLIK